MMQLYYLLREWFLIYFNTFECLWAFFMIFMIQLIILHSNEFKLKILITIFAVAHHIFARCTMKWKICEIVVGN